MLYHTAALQHCERPGRAVLGRGLYTARSRFQDHSALGAFA